MSIISIAIVVIAKSQRESKTQEAHNKYWMMNR